MWSLFPVSGICSWLATGAGGMGWRKLRKRPFPKRLFPDFFEVKRDPRRIDLAGLGRKVEAFFEKNPSLKERTHSLAGLSMDDM